MKSLSLIGLSLLCGVLVASDARQAEAQNAARIRPPAAAFVPVFGFNSHYAQGGENVTRVQRHSLADSIGLEPGDKITAVNGQRLCYDGHWFVLIRQAAFQGHATLAIRDWRTGRTVFRYVNLGRNNNSAKQQE